jgi:outer membrane protein OmpA-like peptidoglycan-associated protein
LVYLVRYYVKLTRYFSKLKVNKQPDHKKVKGDMEKNKSILIIMMFLSISIPIFAEKSGVRFDTDKATLKPESFEILDTVGTDIMNYYHADAGLKVTITGHTDSRASNAYNKNLSDRRANTVKKYFIEKLGIPETNFYSEGFGEEKPIAANDTDEGMAINRRVEVEYAGRKVILSSVILDTPTTEIIITNTATPEISATNASMPTPEKTYTPVPQATPAEEKRSNRLGFIGMTGIGMPFGGQKGDAVYDHMAGKIGLEMGFANRICLNLESSIYRLFKNTDFVSEFGEFALGANYEFSDGFLRPYAGAKAILARSKMKNGSYTPGLGIDGGIKMFFSEYIAAVAGAEFLGMSNSLYTANLNIGIEIYTDRDDKWGWKYNAKEYKEMAEGGEIK